MHTLEAVDAVKSLQEKFADTFNSFFFFVIKYFESIDIASSSLFLLCNSISSWPDSFTQSITHSAVACNVGELGTSKNFMRSWA